MANSSRISPTFSLTNGVWLVNATVVLQPSSGTNATVTQCFACITTSKPDLYEGLVMTLVNFTVGTSFTNSVILKVSGYFTVTGPLQGFSTCIYGNCTTGQFLSAIGSASVVQAIIVG